MLDSLNQTVFLVGSDAVTYAELLGFLFGAAAVGLAAMERVSNFPVGILMSIFFGILFLDAKLFANAYLQLIYIGLGAWGWWAWTKGGKNGSALSVERASPQLIGIVLTAVVVCTAVLVPILKAAEDPAPFLDSLTTGMSLGAQALLNLKRIETWWLWLAVDLVYVPFYASQGLWLTATVYVGFLLLCIVGIRHWRGQLKTSVPRPVEALA